MCVGGCVLSLFPKVNAHYIDGNTKHIQENLLLVFSSIQPNLLDAVLIFP